MNSANPDYFFDDDGKLDDEDDFTDMMCGLHSDGQCGNAGSEYCDFECPYRDSELFAGSDAWCAKHSKATS